MESKKKKELMKEGKNLETSVRIGKQGISDNMISEIKKTFSNKELIKVKFLRSVRETEDVDEMIEKIIKKTGSTLIKKAGFMILLHKIKPKEISSKELGSKKTGFKKKGSKEIRSKRKGSKEIGQKKISSKRKGSTEVGHKESRSKKSNLKGNFKGNTRDKSKMRDKSKIRDKSKGKSKSGRSEDKSRGKLKIGPRTNRR